MFSVVCGRSGGRGEELPSLYSSKAPATSRWEKSPLGLFVSREPGRHRLWKLSEITKLAVGAGLGSFTTRTRPRPPRLCPLSGTLWVTGLGRARIGPAAQPWGSQVQALGDPPRSQPAWTLRPAPSLGLRRQLRKCQPPLRTQSCHFRPHLGCKRREVGFRTSQAELGGLGPGPAQSSAGGGRGEAHRTSRRLGSLGGRRSRPHLASACRRSGECGS